MLKCLDKAEAPNTRCRPSLRTGLAFASLAVWGSGSSGAGQFVSSHESSSLSKAAKGAWQSSVALTLRSPPASPAPAARIRLSLAGGRPWKVAHIPGARDQSAASILSLGGKHGMAAHGGLWDHREGRREAQPPSQTAIKPRRASCELLRAEPGGIWQREGAVHRRDEASGARKSPPDELGRG